MTDRPLQGRRVVVTRAAPGRLAEALRARGATVAHVPTISFAPPDDAGRALRMAGAALAEGRYDWVVLTSATAVAYLRDTWDDLAALTTTLVAAIGPATADAVVASGGTVHLVPPEAVGESLVAAFPPGMGRVLQIRPAQARDVVATGLRAKGWTVDEVTAYRTVSADLDAAALARVADADLITFTSPSTVQHFLEAVDADDLDARLVAIGPVTAAALRDHGVTVTAVADPHTVDGLVDVIVRVLGR